MIRLAVVLLAGATFVAAQTTSTEVTTTETNTRGEKVRTMSDSGRAIHDQLREKFERAGMHDSGTIEKAREAAREMKQMREKDGAAADSVREQRKAEANVRIQGAIDAMDRRGDKTGSQVQEVRERNQARIAERRQELVELQKRILDRQEARKAQKEEAVTEGDVKKDMANDKAKNNKAEETTTE